MVEYYTYAGTTTGTWQAWTTAASTTASLPWHTWNEAYGTSGTTNTWAGWNMTGNFTGDQLQAQQAALEAWQAQQDLWLKQQREREAERAAAEKVAEQLLLEQLTPAQQKTYREGQYILVTSHDGQRTYRLFKNKHGAELLGADGKPDKHYCVYISAGVPPSDDLLGRKLLFEYAEELALKKANVTHLRGRV